MSVFVIAGGQAYIEGIYAFFALAPDLAAVATNDTFGNGKTQTVASGSAAGFVHAVKSLEDFPALLLG